jgi:16S rRNA (uracil1498-N3)-methyltransferase
VTPRVHVAGGWGDSGPGATVDLTPDQVHHLVTVLRRRSGDAVELFDGSGCAAIAILEPAGAVAAAKPARRMTALQRARPGQVATTLPGRARIRSVLPAQPPPPLAIGLCQGISSGERMDWTIEKAVEAGVGHIVPLQSLRATPRVPVDRIERRLAHWRRIVVSACAQSGQNRLPRLDLPLTPSQWLERDDAPHGHEVRRLLLMPGASSSLAASLSGDAAAPRTVWLASGPEAGFAPDEARLFVDRGWDVVGLGPRTLRTETAALVAVVIIQSRWGDLR